MSTTQDVQRFWQDHAGARWLVPMIALMAVVVFGLLYMLAYPYLSL